MQLDRPDDQVAETVDCFERERPRLVLVSWGSSVRTWRGARGVRSLQRQQLERRLVLVSEADPGFPGVAQGRTRLMADDAQVASSLCGRTSLTTARSTARSKRHATCEHGAGAGLERGAARADLAIFHEVRDNRLRQAAATSASVRSSQELESRGLVVEDEPDLRRNSRRVCSTPSTSTWDVFAGSCARTAGWCTAWTGRSAPYRGFDDGTDRRSNR